MTAERLDIIVREDGSREVSAKIANIGKTAKESTTAVQRLDGILRAIITAGAIQRLQQYADTYSTLQNRLKLVTDSSAQLAVVQQKLFDISQKTRSSLPANIELFSRLAFATKELGVSQSELLTLTERINKAVVISGANPQEAQNALIQLSQGISAGALQGEELRSVLEQLPRVANVIAKELGVLNPDIEITRAALKNLGREGKITPEVILNAFRNFGNDLDEEFNRTTSTIIQSLTKLNNQVIITFGEFDKKVGITSTIVSGLDFLRENIELVGRAALATGIAFSIGLVANGVTRAIIAIKDLTFFILKNPFTFLGQSIAIATGFLTAFSDKITISKDGLITLGDFGKAAFDVLINGSSAVNSNTADTSKNLNQLSIDGQSAFKAISESVVSLIGFLLNASDSVEIFYKTLVLGYREIVVTIQDIPQAFSIAFAKGMNSAIQTVEDGVNTIIKALNSVDKRLQGKEFFKPVSLGRLNENFPRNTSANDPTAIAARERIVELSGNRDKRIQELNRLLDTITNRAKNISQQRIDDKAKSEAERLAAEKALEEAGKATRNAAAGTLTGGAGETGRFGAANDNRRINFKDIINDLDQQAKLLQLNNRERETQNQLINIENQFRQEGLPLNEAEKELLKSRLENLQALSDQARVYDEIKEPLEQNKRAQEALNNLYKQGKISVDEYNLSLNRLKIQALESSRTLEGGLERGLRKVSEEFGNVSTVAENLVVNAFGKAEDALTEFVNTGKLNFKDLVNSIQADLSRLAVRQFITAPLANLFGGAGISSLFGGGNSSTADASKLVSSPSGPVSVSSPGTSGGLFSGLSNLFGFANGGQFQVGGQGGTDSQLVAFRASPNETVTVTKPGQQGVSNGDKIIINIQTQDAASFQRSQGQVLAQFAQSVSRVKKRNT